MRARLEGAFEAVLLAYALATVEWGSPWLSEYTELEVQIVLDEESVCLGGTRAFRTPSGKALATTLQVDSTMAHLNDRDLLGMTVQVLDDHVRAVGERRRLGMPPEVTERTMFELLQPWPELVSLDRIPPRVSEEPWLGITVDPMLGNEMEPFLIQLGNTISEVIESSGALRENTPIDFIEFHAQLETDRPLAKSTAVHIFEPLTLSRADLKSRQSPELASRIIEKILNRMSSDGEPWGVRMTPDLARDSYIKILEGASLRATGENRRRDVDQYPQQKPI
jgi:hypothetical protein